MADLLYSWAKLEENIQKNAIVLMSATNYPLSANSNPHLIFAKLFLASRI